MKRAAEECVTTSLDTAKTSKNFPPVLPPRRGGNSVGGEKDVTNSTNLLKEANV